MIAIGEAARQSGVPIETIRYYERAGVVAKPRRTAAGRRVYAPEDVAALRFVRRCRDLGFSLEDAVALRGLARDPQGACDAAGRLADQHRAKVRDKIADLQRLEAALSELIANCDRGQHDCPMLERLMAGPEPHQTG